MIVIHHFPIALAPAWGKALLTKTQLVDNSYLWVDFFFILSGFLMTHTYQSSFRNNIHWKDYKKFIFARFIRLYPLHFLLLFLFVVFEIFNLANYQYISINKPQYLSVFQEPFSGRKDINAIFINLFMLQGFDYTRFPLFDIKTFWNQPAWSISTQWLIYLILPFLILGLLRKGKITNFIVYILSLLSIILVIHFGKITHLGIPGLIRCVSEGVAGIITYQIFQNTQYRKFFSKSWISVASFISMIFIMHTGFRLVLIVPVFSFLILSISSHRSWITNLLSSQFLLFLGKISYSIYISHWFIQDLIKFSWQATFYQPFPQEMGFGLLSIFLGIEVSIVLFISTLFYILFERPSQKWLKTSHFARKYIYYSSA